MMKKLKKLVAIQPVSLLPETREKIKEYCEKRYFMIRFRKSGRRDYKEDRGCRRHLCQLYA